MFKDETAGMEEQEDPATGENYSAHELVWESPAKCELSITVDTTFTRARVLDDEKCKSCPFDSSMVMRTPR